MARARVSSSFSGMQPALHLAADAAERRRRQHAFGRAADAEVDVDAGPAASVVPITPATSPSGISRMPAPAAAPPRSASRGAGGRAGRRSDRDIGTPLALASARGSRRG